jgi:RNA polymerase sigma-32 factor
MGTTAKQKKLFFHLREAKRRISALDEGDMQPEQVKTIAQRPGVTETDVIYMNRRLGGDASLNAPVRKDDHFGEWQDLLVDERADQEMTLVASEEFNNRRRALASALSVLNDRERRIFEARRLAENPIRGQRWRMVLAGKLLWRRWGTRSIPTVPTHLPVTSSKYAALISRPSRATPFQI